MGQGSDWLLHIRPIQSLIEPPDLTIDRLGILFPRLALGQIVNHRRIETFFWLIVRKSRVQRNAVISKRQLQPVVLKEHIENALVTRRYLVMPFIGQFNQTLANIFSLPKSIIDE